MSVAPIPQTHEHVHNVWIVFCWKCIQQNKSNATSAINR